MMNEPEMEREGKGESMDGGNGKKMVKKEKEGNKDKRK